MLWHDTMASGLGTQERGGQNLFQIVLCNTPASKASREVANLTEKKKSTHNPLRCQRICLYVCLSVCFAHSASKTVILDLKKTLFVLRVDKGPTQSGFPQGQDPNKMSKLMIIFNFVIWKY